MDRVLVSQVVLKELDEVRVRNELLESLLKLAVRQLYLATGGSARSRDLHPCSELLERIDDTLALNASMRTVDA